jgi:transcriptional regulator with XRE-family HTH domain
VNLKKLDPLAGPRAAFGHQLRRSRNEKRLTQDQLGVLLGCKGAHISGLETGAKSPSLRLANKADEVFGTGRTFWTLWRAIQDQVLLDGFGEYSLEELKAAKIRVFELGIIPGLLQTMEYATALAQSNVLRGAITEEQARERLSFLASRQKQLVHRPGAPWLSTVMEESCLRRLVGSPRVMRDQLDYLAELSARPRITLQVVPFSRGHLRPFNGHVTLLTMPDRTMMGYTESATRGYLERDDQLIRAWDVAYDHLQAGALNPDATLDLMGTVRRDFQHG